MGIRVWLLLWRCNPQMERQMSMGSNMMGMQGPPHSSSCASTHIPSMHSEAKLVSIRMYSHGYVHILCTHVHSKCTRSSSKVLQLSFPLRCASNTALLGLCGFHHLVCNQSCVWTCQCSTGDSGWNKGPFMWLRLGCPPTAWCIS